MYRLYGIYTAFTISYGDVPDPLRICRGKDCAENVTVTRDHCHCLDAYPGAAHNNCNLKC